DYGPRLTSPLLDCWDTTKGPHSHSPEAPPCLCADRQVPGTRTEKKNGFSTAQDFQRACRDAPRAIENRQSDCRSAISETSAAPPFLRRGSKPGTTTDRIPDHGNVETPRREPATARKRCAPATLPNPPASPPCD